MIEDASLARAFMGIRSRAAIVALRCERLARIADDPLANIGVPDFERAQSERAARGPDA